jgi:predicted AlkP superfamily phosphohydrolase/phosphomutase
VDVVIVRDALTSKPAVFILGISGATWKVIDPLIERGLLPNIQSLQNNGCRATLLSVRSAGDKHYRPQVAWASVATGCQPSRHGITRYYHTWDDLTVPPIWEIYQQFGFDVGVYGWPLDWPPRPTKGFIIPSPWARDTRTWPPHLSSIKSLDRERQNAEREGRSSVSRAARLKLIADVAKRGFSLKTSVLVSKMLSKIFLSKSHNEKSLLLRTIKAEVSADIFINLCRDFKPNFMSFHSFLVDFVSHRYWRFHEPDLFPDTAETTTPLLRNAVIDAYVRTDKILGKIIKELPNTAVIAVASEHGMAPEPVSAEVGEWRYVIDGARLLGLLGLGGQLVPCPVARWVAFRSDNDQPLPIDAVARFRNIVVAETGLPLFQVHQHGSDEIVVKFHLDRSVPRYREDTLEDLTVLIDGQAHPFHDVTRRLGAVRSAMHDQEGVLIIKGPGVRAGLRLPDCHVVDVMPTLLKATGLPIPEHVDGSVLDVFDTVGGNASRATPHLAEATP